jgi:hemerythrin-like domain-containing protein
LLIKIGQSADHGFDEPLGLLSDCHRRIERFLDVLLQIARAGGRPLPHPDREALSVALHYFRSAAPRHTADEEQSLFPRLRATPDARARAALDTLARLESDHRTADVHHEAVDAMGTRWLEQGELSWSDAAALREHLGALRTLYETHITVEDRELFPAAAGALSPADLEAIGREMADRRGVAFAPLGADAG